MVLPSIKSAASAPLFIGNHLTAIRVVVLLNVLGLALFLWFLGSLWVRLRQAEGESARGSTLVLVGGVAGAVLQLAGLALIATAGLSTSSGQADVVPTLYTASSLLLAFGGAVYSLFFFGVARVVLHTRALAKWLGVLAVVAAIVCVPAFLTPFFATNVLNPATGALGAVAWAVAFVVWLFLASGAMVLEERRRTGVSRAGGPVVPQGATGTEVAR